MEGMIFYFLFVLIWFKLDQINDNIKKGNEKNEEDK